MTFITHGVRISVVSDVRERVRDFRITFALYVKKISISWVCLVCYTERVYKASIFCYSSVYMQPWLSKNPKYICYTIKSSLTLAYQYILDKGLGAVRAKIGPTSDVDKIFSKMYLQYVLFRNKYS